MHNNTTATTRQHRPHEEHKQGRMSNAAPLVRGLVARSLARSLLSPPCRGLRLDPTATTEG
ncbi:hypothetical protein E2C01_077711 [Portunus trituberculatus]|uniref:Uncharacterized protein n=1 Tax=Portunus trituberculatus TaxID=210409 RepID=A0A5B7IGQ4_PORTR|nr:hypothetical protein [Portunus trituberculatus]